jgi:hypothetical protein
MPPWTIGQLAPVPRPPQIVTMSGDGSHFFEKGAGLDFDSFVGSNPTLKTTKVSHSAKN